MAELKHRSLYGSVCPENFVEGISVQFHITANCDQNCKHCYMHNSDSYKKQLFEPLSKQNILRLVDEFGEFLAKHRTFGLLAITGGDPILSPYFVDLLEYAHRRYPERIAISVMGNSFHIDEDVAQKMKLCGVKDYQISIDGLESVHDSIRKPGSFQDALRAFKILHNAGIKTIAAFTVSKMNVNQIYDVIDFINKQSFIDAFGFDKMSPMGNASDKMNMVLSPAEYKQLLFNVYKDEAIHSNRIYSGKKDNLWKLLLYDLGLTNPFSPGEGKIMTGCVAGSATLSILADGTVFACRRMEIEVGHFPEQSLEDIYLNNKLTPMLLNLNNYQACSACELAPYCRGCPAMAFACRNDMFAKDPCCWRFDDA